MACAILLGMMPSQVVKPVDGQGRRQVGQQEHPRRPVAVHQPQPADHLLDLALADLLDQSLHPQVRVHLHHDGGAAAVPACDGRASAARTRR